MSSILTPSASTHSGKTASGSGTPSNNAMPHNGTPCNATPINQSVSAKSHQCCCDWGPTCGGMNKFFTDHGHPLGGYVKLNYSPSCNFQNVWHSINQYFHPSYDYKAVTQSDFDDIQSSNKKKPSGQKARAQVVVARLHYELNLVNFQDQAGSGY